jgi:hypothetical protein
VSATTGEGDSPARRVLERLLRRAEAARLAGEAKPVSLPMDGKRDGAEYRALRGADEFEAFHARIALAERSGAVTVERDRHRDDGQRLLRLGVADMQALARELGIELLEARMTAATAQLSPWTSRFPVVEVVLGAWAGGRKVRGCGPEAAPLLADAAHAVQARQADTGGERILRRESARLFGSRRSKHLEALTPWLELLVSGDPAATRMEVEHVWSALDLRREPQPLLLAGPGTVLLDDGGAHVLPRSWLGFDITALAVLRTGARALLTIENLASFHEAAAMRGAAPVLLLYTGGMPSPSWRRAYARLLAGLSADAVLYHWGDIDEGGFRISVVLAETAREAGRVLQPWRMSPPELPDGIADAAQVPSATVLEAMCRAATRAGWVPLAAALRARPLLLEQEALDPLLPR